MKILASAAVMSLCGLMGGLSGWATRSPAPPVRVEAASTVVPGVREAATACVAELTCRYDHYQRLVRIVGVRPAIAQMSVDAKKLPEVQADCHNIFHAIGEAAANTMWPDLGKAFISGPVACGDGFHHGVLTASIVKLGRTPQLLEQLPLACSEIESPSYESWECYHGIGHAFYFYYEAEMRPVYERCMALQGDKYGCVSGATMGLVGDDTHRGVDRKDPFALCRDNRDVLDQQATHTCYSMMSVALVRQRTTRGAIEYCNEDLYGQEQRSCWDGTARTIDDGRVVAGKDAELYCDLVSSEEGRKICVIAVATNNAAFFGNQDRALPYCSSYTKPRYAAWCKEYLASAQFSEDSSNAGFDGQFGETPSPGPAGAEG